MNNSGKSMSTLSWEEFSVYLLIDLKLSDNKANISGLKSRYRVIKDWFNDKPFTRENFNLFIMDIKSKGYKPSYLNNFIKVAKHIDKYIGTKVIQDYTHFKSPKYKYIDYLTADEIREIANVKINYARNSDLLNKRYQALYLFMGSVGCRINEALQMRWTDYFSNYAIFRETKNGEDRIVPIRKPIQKLLDELPRGNGTVFEISDNSQVNDDLKRRAKACKIKKRVYNHLFRHSFVSIMLKLKVSETYIRRITGHKSAASMEGYAHAMIDDLESVMDMHPLNMEDQTLKDLSERYKDFTEVAVNKGRFNTFIEETHDYFCIKIAKLM